MRKSKCLWCGLFLFYRIFVSKPYLCRAGVDVNVDLCEDSGAAAALFQNDGVGLAYGWITQTDCQTWLNNGAVVHM